MMEPRDRLIVDLGMNNGDDTAYYLARGYDVLAVEANPRLCDQARQRFAAEIASGRLTILNAAIWDTAGEVTFHVNLDNDHWSSIETGWAGRDNSRTEAITVESLTLPDLFEQAGVPHYLKIDVEGVDLKVLEQLRGLPAFPARISVEDCRFGFDYMRILAECGYDGFKLLDQSTVPGLTDETRGLPFPAGSSGPLGDDIDGPWLSYEEVVGLYARTVRDHDGTRIAPRSQWWDIHAARIAG